MGASEPTREWLPPTIPEPYIRPNATETLPLEKSYSCRRFDLASAFQSLRGLGAAGAGMTQGALAALRLAEHSEQVLEALDLQVGCA